VEAGTPDPYCSMCKINSYGIKERSTPKPMMEIKKVALCCDGAITNHRR